MPLTAGVRLGPYEILAPLGAGGMGEVYKARDTRLDRTVAIKILPTALASDPQFRERFDCEARTISQFDHPHICALHDVGEQDGTAFLVMQYLEGETLEHRLKKGALALDRAVSFAIQITDALDKAHRAGIAHRDLKPGNIMLTKSGAKLLHFGLATAGAAPGVVPGGSMLPTTPPNLTAQGTILGTFQYMAPEQIEGDDADARTDIFAFGVVLYEMVAGKKAFEGKKDNQNIWLIDLSRGGATPLTFDAANDQVSIWSPDGGLIASNRNGLYDRFVKPSTGSAPEHALLGASSFVRVPVDWSHEGRFLLYQSAKTGWDLGALPMSGDRPGKPIDVVKTPFEERGGQVSPDTYWVAYQSNERGGSRSTCSRFAIWARSGRCRRLGAPIRGGAPTARSCFSSRRTGS